MTNIAQHFVDGLRNIITGRGSQVDKSAHNIWLHIPMQPDQVEHAFRGSWMMRKATMLPATDMVREWRRWELDPEVAREIEKRERKLKLRAQIKQALIYGRLGGGLLFLGTNASDPEQPLSDGEELLFLKALPHTMVTPGELEWDTKEPDFAEPAYFSFSGANQQDRIHPSRVVVFKGEIHPGLTALSTPEQFWGDSTIEVINKAVQNSTAANDGFAGLVEDARVDVFRLADLADQLLAPGGEERVQKRMDTVSLGKSLHRAAYLDKEDEWEQRQITWAGMPDIIKTFLMIVSAATDIPATRFLNKAPDGQNSTGESDDRNYRSMIGTKQDDDLRPALEKIDPLLLRGINLRTEAGQEAEWEFNPLHTPTEKEQAEIDNKRADTANKWVQSGLIPMVALAKGAQSQLIDAGTYPALKDAIKALPEADQVPDPEDNPDDPSRIRALPPEDPRRVAANDATPRSLYVSRKVENAEDIIAWAKRAGFTTTLPADDMHVTIIYSETKVDWMEIDPDWSMNDDGRLTVDPGGARLVEQFQPAGAVVLLFNSSNLAYRHERMKEAGATSNFADYQPHITLTYDPPADLDLSTIEPYRGKIVLGPELFAEVDPDWEPGGEV